MPWLMNQDAALKYQLQGIRVTDQNAPSGRPVAVRYRSPEDEVARYTPPLILIEMPVLSMALERAHQGSIQLPYVPEGPVFNSSTGTLETTPAEKNIPAQWQAAFNSPNGAYDPGLSPYETWFPVPYDITYQITVYARMAREHLMPIMAALEQEQYLGRFARLVIPQTNTFERITRMAGPTRSYEKDDKGKRLFRATYMIRVATELVGPVVDMTQGGPFGLADDINLNIAYGISNMVRSPYYNESDLSSEDVKEAIGILGTRMPVAWNTAAS